MRSGCAADAASRSEPVARDTWLATILAALLNLALLWFVLVAPNLH